MKHNKQKNTLYYTTVAILLVIIAVMLGRIIGASRPTTQNAGQEVQQEGVVQSAGKWLVSNYLNPLRIFLCEVPIVYGHGLDQLPEPDLEQTEFDEGIDIQFEVSREIQIEIEKLKEEQSDTPFTITGGGEPNVLIYHTHTTEAFRQEEGKEYKENGEYRTKEEDKNIVGVGNLLAEELSKYGFNVIHDKTDHEPPKLSTAYNRSLETMLKYQKEYPSIQLFIDLHRDAANVETAQDDVVEIDGKRCARVMCVVGTGDKYNDKPNWKSNYQLATLVTDELNSMCENFARPIRVKTGRYNQHMSDTSLLIEVGHNANTLQEAKNSIPYIAKAINAAVSQK